MEVSQIAELDTHAVIGGRGAEAFGMSDSAEFFTVLSDTLYRDKERAMVREVICNAWDAHIAAGKTNLPVEIILNEDELIIRDFGAGIADERMGPIYCIYGKSTKVHDGNQTGGFGLGSKAPFAYSHHFTVTSCHRGVRTVYSISRGGSTTDGKPELRRMVSVPTDETGLTVSVPVQDDTLETLRRNIAHVVKQGGIKATLNGEELKAFDYTEARKVGYGVPNRSTGETIGEYYGESAFVLYGSVLYSLATTNPVVKDAVKGLMALLPAAAEVILIAPPHSIGVTPSRESLSYTERTTSTILKLIKRLTGQLRAHRHLGRKFLIDQLADKVTSRTDPFNYHNRGSESLNIYQGWSDAALISDATLLARAAAAEKILEESLDLPELVAAAMRRKFPNQRRALRRMFQSKRKWTVETMFRTSRLHLRAVERSGLAKHLYVFSDPDVSSWKRAVDKNRSGSRGHALPVLFLAPTTGALKDGVYKWNNAHQDAKPLRVAGGPRVFGLVKPKLEGKALADLRRWCAHYKIEIIQAEVVKKEPKEAKPKIVKVPKEQQPFWGLDALGGPVFFSGYSATSSYKIREAANKTLLDPDFYLPCSNFGRTRFHSPDDLNRSARDLIAELFPKTAVVTSPVDLERLTKRKAKSLHDAVLDEIEKAADRQDALYAYARSKKFFNDNVYAIGSPTETVLKLAELDLELCKFLFPTKIKLKPDSDRVFKLLSIAECFGKGTWSRSRTGIETRRKEIIARFDKAAREAFASYTMDRHQSDEKFAWLRTLRIPSSVDRPGEIEHLRTVVRMLKRAFDKPATATPETP